MVAAVHLPRFAALPDPGAPVIALLVHDGHERQTLAAALAELTTLEIVDDVAALDRLVEATALDAIVATWRDGLAEVAARLRLPLIVVAAVLPEALVDAVGRGVAARWVADAARLPDVLRGLTRGVRTSDRRRHRVAGVSVRWRGAARAATSSDLSNDGVSFEVSDADVEALLPGSALDELTLLRHDRVCLSGVRALVRHVEPLAAPGRYRVGCALKPIATQPAAPTHTLRDPALCAALVKAGLRSGLVVTQLDSDERDGATALQLVGGRVDAAAGTLTAACERALGQHDLVRGHFEVGGRLYRFVTVVTAEAPLTLRLPAVLEETQQRAAARYRPKPDETLAVEVRSPLTDITATKPIIDLSSNGLSFTLDGARDLYPLGLRVEATLHLPDGPLACAGVVRTLTREGARLRCGVELCGLDEAAHLRLANFVMRLRFPSVDDGGSVTCDELFDFFRATGFLHPAKEEALAPVMSEVRAALTALYAQPSRLFKAVVARDDGTLVGHVSGVRAYRHTWMSQHLAAYPSKHVAHLLNLGAAEYFGQNPDLEFFKIYFHADNKWPARVFGGFARMLRDSSQSVLRAYRHVTLTTEAPPPGPTPAGIDVLEASPDDLALVERYFVTRERGLLLRADDLTRPALQLSELNRSYGALGLYRRRRVLLALRKNVCLGFALAELSSPGLNLSEALSAFQIFITDEGNAAQDAVRRALLHTVVPIYRNAGRTSARGLLAPDEVDAYARIGVPVSAEQSMCWTCHRGLYPRFCDHVERLFAALERRGRRA